MPNMLEGESIKHVLFTCPLARQVWTLSRYLNPLGGGTVSLSMKMFTP